MRGASQILPVHGEGDREAVEGVIRHPNGDALATAPSVSPSGCHLPVNGEESL